MRRTANRRASGSGAARRARQVLGALLLAVSMRRLSSKRAGGESGRRVLIIVQNLPVPLDRRVWLECQTLRDAGYTVSVICPKGPGDASYEELDGVHLHKYAPPPVTTGALSFVVEYAYCWVRTAVLALRIAFRRGFDVIQTCNPPDTYFLLAAPFKTLGARFVYDQHDLCPEMYFSRFGRDDDLFAAGLRTLERATYALADHVIATNGSYAGIAVSRGRVPTGRVSVVRSGPDPDVMRPRDAVPSLRRGHDHMVVWLGIMGPQDGVDLALRAAARFVHEKGRTDTLFALLGFGDAQEDLERLTRELRLEPWVVFTGRAGPDMVADYLSTADLGLVPDPKTPYADLSTHNKTLEYMAFGLPVVAFDLKETRVSAEGAARYVPADDVDALADAVAELLDDPDTRLRMGELGRFRLVDELSWPHQAPRYLDVFERLLEPVSDQRGR